MPAILRALLACCLLTPALLLAQPKLMPVDEGPSDPEFFAFRAQLQIAIARHDARAIEAALDPQVKLSFGEANGLEDFKKIWRPDAPDSALWETLGTVLALGGSFDTQGDFYAPYVASKWPQDLDVYEHMATIATGVPVLQAPKPGATVIAKLDFAIVEVGRWDARWIPVKLSEHRKGYVERRFLRTFVDHRVVLSKRSGSWRIDLFLSGD